MKYTDVARRKVQHICIFGDPKSGKSELAASCAAFFKKVIWVSTDNGHEVVFKLPPELLQKFEFIILPDTKEFPVAVDTCLKMVSGAEISICDSHGQVACSHCKKLGAAATWTTVCLSKLQTDEVIVFDHISQVADSAMNFITKNKSLEYKPEWSDYHYQGAIMSKILMNIQQAPYNCICLAHTTETEMEDGTKKLVPLVGTVPFSRNVGKYFDHIIYCRVANKKHTFGSSTIFVSSVLTGSRSDVILESQKEGRPSLEPFFEGKMEYLKVEAEKITSTEELQELKEKVEKEIEVSDALAPEQEKEVVEEKVPKTVEAEVKVELKVDPIPKSMTSAEAAKARLAAMRAGRGA